MKHSGMTKFKLTYYHPSVNRLPIRAPPGAVDLHLKRTLPEGRR